MDAKKGNDTQAGVGTTSDKAYKTVAAAVADAHSGDTIMLAAGTYTLYGADGVATNKSLTFVGADTQKTTWNIGTLENDANGQSNGDFGFRGAKTLIFRNMTLKAGVTPSGTVAGGRDYMGFAHTDKTIVENCVIEGKTFYWGYTSATFKDTTFNCPSGDYAIWTYSSPEMTFDHCTFNSSGKVINVYTDYSAGKHDITVNFNGCTVNNSNQSLKPVLNINDSNMGNYKYVINISGANVVNGVDTDKTTCSRLFGFGGKAADYNKGKTIVNFGNTTVWQNGEMVDARAYHNSGVTADGVTYTNNVEGSNNSLYAEGYKDNALDTTTSGWTTTDDGKISRTVTKTCKYCGYKETVTQYQGKLTYDANGGKGATDPAPGAAGGSVTVAKNGFKRSNYTFTGWNTQADGKGTAYKPGDSFTLTDKDTVLYAQWSKNSGGDGTDTNGTAKPTDSPKTGDNRNLVLWFTLLFVSGGAAIGTTVVSRKKKYNR